jgi:hypothetical protein
MILELDTTHRQLSARVERDRDGCPCLVLEKTVWMRADNVLIRRLRLVRATPAERRQLQEFGIAPGRPARYDTIARRPAASTSVDRNPSTGPNYR